MELIQRNRDEEALNGRGRFLSRISLRDNGCIEWIGCVDKSNGYGKLRLGGKYGWNVFVHRLSWFYEKGEWPTKLACHKCDNKICVNPEHIFDGSDKDNMHDASVKGILLRKISLAQRDQIIELIKNTKLSYNKIGKMFGVSGTYVNQIGIASKPKKVLTLDDLR